METTSRRPPYLSAAGLWRRMAVGLACTAGVVGSRDRFAAQPGQEALAGQAWAPQTPKVALAFLSMGRFPQEATWRRWFEAARDQVALAPLWQGGCAPEVVRHAVAPARHADNPIAAQQLFSVYVHVPPDAPYPAESMFAPYVVQTRVATQWGTHTLNDAMRAVLAAGFVDEDNRVFVTMSDDAVPLHPPPVFYQSAMHFPVSRINPCLGGERSVWRWHESMATPGLATTLVPLEAWRKSSQWFQLRRAHVASLLQDHGIDATFRDHCHIDRTDCTSDEHYPATALSLMGLSRETDCQGSIMFTDWRDGGAHPHLFEDEDITPGLLDAFAARPDCHPQLAQSLASYGFVRRGTDGETARLACEVTAPWSEALLGSTCPLMARKFAESAAPHVARWTHQMLRESAGRAGDAALPATREEVWANVTAIARARQAENFPEAGCASSRRDYVWPRGVFMDFACPDGNAGDASMIEALRCYAQETVCEPAIAEKRRFYAVDSAFADTLEGEGAMNDGVRVLHALRSAAKPSRHRNVMAGVLAAVRGSVLSVPFYVDEFEVITPDNQVALVSALWFDSDVAADTRDERYADYSAMLGRMVRNPTALATLLEALFRRALPPFVLPARDAGEFEAAAALAEALVRTLAMVPHGALHLPVGGLLHDKKTYALGVLVPALGRRLRGAEQLYPDIAWVSRRADGYSMLGAVMVALAQGHATADAAARWQSMDMAADPMQPTQMHRRAAEDLSTLMALARTLAKRVPG